MVPDSSMILYACISIGTTVLADFSAGDGELKTLALKCLERKPPFHLLYSHTTGKRIYCFLIEDPFVFFAIVDERLGKSQGFRFLDSVETSFRSLSKRQSLESTNHLNSGCFQEEFDPVFRSLVHLPEEKDQAENPDPNKGKSSVASQTPPLGKQISNGEGIGDVSVENVPDPAFDASEVREQSLSPQKNGRSGAGDGGLQQARRIWRQQARMVLLVDFVVCCTLFCVWLTICKGFRCMGR